MRKIKAIFYIISIALISGCSTTIKMPPKAEFTYHKNSKIAVVNRIEDKLWQVHVGTTVLTNFKKQHVPRIDIKKAAYDYLEEQLKIKFGYELVPLSPEKWTELTNSEQLIKTSILKSENNIDESKKTLMKDIAKSNGYVAVIEMISRESGDIIYSTNQKMPHYGTFSRSFMGNTKHNIFYNIKLTGVSLDPPYYLGDSQGEINILSSEWKKKLYTPFNNDCIKECENLYKDCQDIIDETIWEVVKTHIDKFISKLPLPKVSNIES